MARENLSVQRITRDGVEPTYTAAVADGHAFANQNGDVFVHVKNTDAASKTITFITPRTVEALAVADLAVTVPANEERFVGRFPTGTYNQDDATVHVDYSDVTGVTVAALK